MITRVLANRWVTLPSRRMIFCRGRSSATCKSPGCRDELAWLHFVGACWRASSSVFGQSQSILTYDARDVEAEDGLRFSRSAQTTDYATTPAESPLLGERRCEIRVRFL